MSKNIIFILHPGKANYPEIDAYTSYFSKLGYKVENGTVSDYKRFNKKFECILWCIMGFFPKNLNARYVIHDYRSLSVGRLAYLKDSFKRIFNSTPNLRIFQNIRMRDVMGFSDKVENIILPMGVPDWIFELPEPGSDIPNARFCYIGEMSRERGFDKILSAYRDANKQPADTLILVGDPERSIYEEFKNVPGVTFTGRLPQKDALAIVKRSEFAICYFPYHRPHCFQTPTKLLEYISLRKKIICNDSPSNVNVIDEFCADALITGETIFVDFFNAKAVAINKIELSNPDLDKRLSWGSVIKNSSILSILNRNI